MPKEPQATPGEESSVDIRRRRVLTAAVSVVGGGVAVAAALPMLATLGPSAAARAAGAPVEVDVSKVGPGQLITVVWRTRPVWVLRRTPEQLAALPAVVPNLKDPRSQAPQQLPPYANAARSLQLEIFVTVAICTHLGCVPTYRPEPGAPDLGADWKGGFFCPCHGSRFDLAGRVYQGSPAPLNLPVPPYHFVTDTLLRIGELADGSEQNWAPVVW